MSLLTRLFESRASLENPAISLNDLNAWRDVLGGRRADTDESITVDKALTLSPVWCAVKMISGDCAKLPIKTYRYRRDGDGKDVDRGHQAWQFIHRDGLANEETTALDLWREYFAGALLWENGYIWIDRSDDGRIWGLYNLLPDRTAPVRVRGRRWYVSEIGGELVPIPQGDVLHLKGLSWGQDAAPALVEQARHDFGVALASRRFASKFFRNGAQHGGILMVPDGAAKIAREKIEEAIDRRMSDPDRAFRTLVLRDGYRWQSTQVDARSAQLKDLDEAKVRDVARWFMLAPSRLGVRESVSYNSRESDRQDYYDTTLSYWLSGNQAQCNAKLLSQIQVRRGTHVIRYQINALLWADAKARAEIASAGIQSGRFSPDETRDWEGMNPRPDGEGGVFLRPVNMEAVGGDATIDTDPDPDTDTEPADSVPADRSASSDPLRRLLQSTLARCVRRLSVQAARGLKHAAAWGEAWETVESEQRAALEGILGDVVQLVSTLDHRDSGREESQASGGTAAAVVERLYERIRADLRAGVPADWAESTAGQRSAYIAQSFAAAESSIPAALAAETITGETTPHAPDDEDPIR